jgi:hypothetical protein
MYFATAISKSSMFVHEPRLRVRPDSYRTSKASASALSSESPVDPTDATAPAPARRWV